MLSSMTTTAPFFFFVCLLTTTANFQVCFCNGIGSSSGFKHTHNNITCLESEREALLKFKQDLKDPSNRLSSWIIGGDCCQWAGVVCDNFTGHVRQIRLHNPAEAEYEVEYEVYRRHQLRGKVNHALLDLKHLQYLDLSNNDFEGTPIPSFIGSIATLRYLNLSMAEFAGSIPPQLGNVTTMRCLDLGDNFALFCQSLEWLKSLVSLEHLVLRELDWLQVTSNLPSLAELHLSACELEYVLSPFSPNQVNFTSLGILDLSENDLEQSVLGWIENMTSLRVLDLSFNSFNSTIPNWLYSLSHLESLSLQWNIYLQGALSIAIGNLTSLVGLDLSENQLQGSIPTSLGKLCKLKTISLSGNEFSREVGDLFVGFSRCKSCRLQTFDSSRNQLIGHLPSELGQLTSLTHLDLSANSFSGPIPASLGSLSSLISLDLSGNSFCGPIPASIGSLSSLISLDLSGNSFCGPIPASIGSLSSLISLHLSENKFNGTLPESFGRLGNLDSVSISVNSLEGVVGDVHFANLTRLRYLDAGGNNLALKVRENWVPPFQLGRLNLDSWQIGPQFPFWLTSQNKLLSLSIANTRISDSIPTLFWPILFKLHYANLSHNLIHGEILSVPIEGYVLDFNSNLFNGSLPFVSRELEWLDLSNNSFSGSLHHMLCDKGEEHNTALNYLNMGHNRLSGEIPDCWKHWQRLGVIKLENNNLEGSIPNSILQLPYLQSLHLRHNHLTGELPQTLQYSSSLLIIDLGENKLTGTIPPWMGNMLLGLIVLDLRSNNFLGSLPHELCRLSSLQVLDLAHNNLIGPVPGCFANFSVMAKISNSSYSMNWDSVNSSTYVDNAFVVTKGRDVEYTTTLGLVTSIDLSENNLFGEIPEELTKLVGLWSLNLSDNHLTGRIPRNMGDMRLLESLDFSQNQLYGEIPSSMSSLTFLSHLNLSYNNLTGTIPSSTQLQLMDESSFMGNKLCGPPLKSCFLNKMIPPNDERQGGGERILSDPLFFASVALGFAVGFWIVLGPLLFKRSWRIAYFRVIEDTWHKVCDFMFECCYIFHR